MRIVSAYNEGNTQHESFQTVVETQIKIISLRMSRNMKAQGVLPKHIIKQSYIPD